MGRSFEILKREWSMVLLLLACIFTAVMTLYFADQLRETPFCQKNESFIVCENSRYDTCVVQKYDLDDRETSFPIRHA